MIEIVSNMWFDFMKILRSFPDNLTMLQVYVIAISVSYFIFVFEKSCFIRQFGMSYGSEYHNIHPCRYYGEEGGIRAVANSQCFFVAIMNKTPHHSS